MKTKGDGHFRKEKYIKNVIGGTAWKMQEHELKLLIYTTSFFRKKLYYL